MVNTNVWSFALKTFFKLLPYTEKESVATENQLMIKNKLCHIGFKFSNAHNTEGKNKRQTLNLGIIKAVFVLI